MLRDIRRNISIAVFECSAVFKDDELGIPELQSIVSPYKNSD